MTEQWVLVVKNEVTQGIDSLIRLSRDPNNVVFTMVHNLEQATIVSREVKDLHESKGIRETAAEHGLTLEWKQVFEATNRSKEQFAIWIFHMLDAGKTKEDILNLISTEPKENKKVASDIVKEEDIPEDDCEVCHLHEEAYEALPKALSCPHCNAQITKVNITQGELSIVGETNFYSPDQIVRMMAVEMCGECGNRYGLLPVPISYNGNHDIYYTGGQRYIVNEDGDFKLSDEMKFHINNYHERLLAGEDLEPQNLIVWLSYDIEHMVAERLYKYGLKI